MVDLLDECLDTEQVVFDPIVDCEEVSLSSNSSYVYNDKHFIEY